MACLADRKDASSLFQLWRGWGTLGQQKGKAMQEQDHYAGNSAGFRLTGIFLFWFLMLTIVMALVVTVSPDTISGLLARAAGAIPLLIAALLTGQSHARHTGTVAPSGLAWKLAVLFALIALSLSAVVAAFMLPLGEILGTLGYMFAALVCFIFVISILATRILIGIGARSVLGSASR